MRGLLLNNYKISTIRQRLLSRGCVVFGEYSEYVSPSERIFCQDMNGYKYDIVANSVYRNRKLGKFVPQNKFSIDNIKLWLSQNEDVMHLELLSESYLSMKSHLSFKCKLCNQIFCATLSNTYYQMCSCPYCAMSKGEKAIKKYLDKYGIEYTEQHKFDDCKLKRPLKFDFFISNVLTAIEFQGRQHYQAGDFYGGKAGFIIRQKRDEIKRNYCKRNKIKLIEIPYWNLPDIDEILNELRCEVAHKFYIREDKSKIQLEKDKYEI